MQLNPSLSAKQIDLITNAVAGIQTLIGLGFLIEIVSGKEALIGLTVTTILTSFLSGKGVPSVLEIAATLQEQTGTNVSQFKS